MGGGGGGGSWTAQVKQGIGGRGARGRKSQLAFSERSLVAEGAPELGPKETSSSGHQQHPEWGWTE